MKIQKNVWNCQNHLGKGEKKIFKKSREFSLRGGGSLPKKKKFPTFFWVSICVLNHPEMQRKFFLLGGGV